ncbi:MAG: hypothetical protein IPH86_15335 [bacterium]|nr:hypothetical protein [bacterium]
MGARQDEAPRCVVLVDKRLDIREQVGRALCLVDDQSAGLTAQELARVVERVFALTGILQVGVGQSGKSLAGERRLAGLAGPVRVTTG